MGCFSGGHVDLLNMTTIDYTGAFIQEGEPDPVMDQMNEFLKLHVNFDD